MLAGLFSWQKHVRRMLVEQTIALITGAGLEATSDIHRLPHPQKMRSGWPGGVFQPPIPDDFNPWTSYLPLATVAEAVRLLLKLVKGMSRDAK